MKKLLSGLISLIIFIAIGATGAGFFVNSKSLEMADQAIDGLKAEGYELSGYESLEIDYFDQSASLKNLIIEGSGQDFKLKIGELKLEGIDPISDFSIYIENSILSDIEVTFEGLDYQIKNITANGLKTTYQPHFERMLAAQNDAEKIKILHEELSYNGLSFTEFMMRDKVGNVSRVADGSYDKQALFNNLPSQWRAHLTGLEINQAHLPAETAQLLKDYKLEDLNGILDVSFDYHSENRTALFAINNLNFGGLANLQSEILLSMTDQHFAELYDFDQFEHVLDALPIEHAELTYEDFGLYNYFVAQQAPKMELTETVLKSQIFFGLALISAQVTDLDRRSELANPLSDFLQNPAGLRIEFSPAKPVRFQQYLNVYDANVLVRDLNPSITYIK
ncbi:MAG: hypothetical protein COB24_06825 [Hyphomicrobiales bacterium]|nr:MAG: hypothetical protein COB24_06825 [Hyphomicrobiales bacterium]